MPRGRVPPAPVPAAAGRGGSGATAAHSAWGASDPGPLTPEAIKELTSLAARARRGLLLGPELDRSVVRARELLPLLGSSSKTHKRDTGLAVSAAAVIALRGALCDAAPALERLAVFCPGAAEVEETLHRVLDSAFSVLALNDRLAELPSLLRLGQHLALEPAPSTDQAVGAWAAQARLLRASVGALAGRGDWSGLSTLVPFLDAVPPGAGTGAAEQVVAARSEWLSAALRANETKAALAAHEGLWALWSSVRTVPAASAVARGVEGLLDVNRKTDFLEYSAASRLLEQLLAVANGHPEAREIARALASASRRAALLVVAARDASRMRVLPVVLSVTTTRFPGDEEIAVQAGRAVAAMAAAYCDEHVSLVEVLGSLVNAALRKPDKLLASLAEALETIGRSCPESFRLARARERFETVTRLRVRPPPGAPRMPPLHEDIVRMREAFAALQQGPSEEAAAELIHIVGTRPRLPRVVQEGELVYSTDQPYFLDLLEELSRQLRMDRSGFWARKHGQLELMTRCLVEDATAAIAQTAQELRRQLGFPEV